MSEVPVFGTRERPSIGGVPWNGSIYLDAPPGLDPIAELEWRCQYDFVWVFENLITIHSKDKNKPTKFLPNRPQCWPLWNLVQLYATGQPSWLWMGKGRQFGFSTMWATILFICAALRGENGLMLAHREAPGKTIFSKAEMALKTLPTLELDEHDAEGNVIGTQVISLVEAPRAQSAGSLMSWLSKQHSAVLRRESAENRDAGVGETYQHAQFTETPLFPDAPHTVGHLIPALSRTPGTFVGSEFTGRVEGDYSNDMWDESLEDDGLFRSVFSAWYWHTPYKDPKEPNDKPLDAKEQLYRESVARIGHEYPLTPSGHLIPRLQEIYDRTGTVKVHDLAVGFELSDEQLLFRRKQIKGFAGDTALWNTEYPATPEDMFRSAKRKLIPSEVMDQLDGAARDPLDGDAGRGEYVAHQGSKGKARTKWQPRRDGRVQRFELPRAESTYMVWADPSSGAGVDPTGAGIYRVSYQLCTLVVSFEDFIRPYELARLLARMGRHYRDGMTLKPLLKKLDAKSGRPSEIVVERNGFGEHVIHELRELKYPRVWRFTDESKDNWSKGHDYGFPTKKSTKMPMLQKLAQGAYDGRLVVPCRRTLSSMRNMQYLDDLDTQAGAPRGQHDDLAMGGGIGYWAASESRAFKFRPVEKRPEWLNELTDEYRAG